MEIDPRLQDVSHREPEYSAISQSSYTLNPIRLPPPPQHALPSLTQDEGHPYYALQQGQTQASQSAHPALSEPSTHQDTTASLTPRAEDGVNGDLKRPRACEACRGLKVRCEPDSVKGTCRRCAKAGRQCIVTVPSRKRQKKTDSRVAELEKKIDALTASLQATKSQAMSGSDGGSSEEEEQQEASSVKKAHSQKDSHQWLEQPEALSSNLSSSRKRRRSSYRDDQAEVTRIPTSYEARNPQRPKLANIDISRRASNLSSRPLSTVTVDTPLPGHEYADVVDRKIIDAATAADIFHNYTKNMACHMPFVVFPPNVSAGDIRRTKPILFLAILSVAAGRYRPDLQPLLQKEITKVYADSVIYKGEKSIELLQALQISTIWYWPENHKDTRPYQLSHVASIMAISMGLNLDKHSKRNSSGSLGLWKDRGPTVDTSSLDCRRAWLGCYFLSASSALNLRLLPIIRWDSYMERCVKTLENSEEAMPSDKVLCQWIRLQQVADDVRLRFEYRCKDNTSCLSDQQAQSDMREILERLTEWEKQVPKNTSSGTLYFSFCIVTLFAHQTGMCANYNVDDPGKINDRGLHTVSNAINPAQAETLKRCLLSIHQTLESFLSLSAVQIQTLPTFCFMSVSYATVFLLKLHFTAVSPKSGLRNYISAAGTHLEQYLQRLLDLLKLAAADDRSRPAQKFLMVLVMLKGFFQRQTGVSKDRQDVKIDAQPVDIEPSTPKYKQISMDGFRGDGQEYTLRSPKKQQQLQPQDPPRPQILPSQQPKPQPQQIATTPLHLLSEVATGDQGASGLHNQSMNMQNDGWYSYNDNMIVPQAPGAYQGNAYYNPPPPLNDGSVDPGMNIPYPGIVPAIDAGLEQVLGMSFGTEADLSSMFMDEGWLQGNQGILGQYNIAWDGQHPP